MKFQIYCQKFDVTNHCAVYRPNLSVDVSSFIDVVEELSLPYDNIILGGDFNSNLFRENSLSLKMSALGLHLGNTSETFPTNFTNTSNTALKFVFYQ